MTTHPLRSLLGRLACAILAVSAVACTGPTRVETFEVTEPVTAVRVATGSGDVFVRAVPGQVVKVEALIEGTDTHLARHVTDGVLTLDTRCPGFSVLSGCSIQYIVEVPRGVAVDADTGSGDLSVDGVRGGAALTTGSGDLSARDITGDVALATGSGDIDIDGFDGDALAADTGSGRITGRGVNASVVVANTGSGDVDLALVAEPARIDIDTGSGGVRLAVPAGAYAVDADTGSGDIDIDGITVDAGAARVLHIDTGSGDIAIRGR